MSATSGCKDIKILKIRVCGKNSIRLAVFSLMHILKSGHDFSILIQALLPYPLKAKVQNYESLPSSPPPPPLFIKKF